MKELKKRCIFSMLVCFLLTAGFMTACAVKKDDAEENVAEVDMKNEWKDTNATEEDQKDTNAAEEDQKDMNATEENQTDAKPRTLSDQELSEFTVFVTEGDRHGNYGFLLSVYDSPEKINLEEVFYTGAGIETEPLSKEEEGAFLKAAGYEEISTDIVRLTTSQINEVLLKRTGLSYEQMENPLQWTYLPEYDAYYHEAGDTNYAAYTCIDGTTADEKYFRLRFRRNDNLAEGAYHQLDTETVLEKTEEGYRFISNRLITEEGLIEDQTFQTNIAEFGEVTVAAYEPDTEKEPLSDVTFVVLKDGQIITYLQGMEPENIRQAVFHKVECVSFPDYNRDGYTDMIAICSYFSGTDSHEGEAYKEVRIYSGTEWGYFYLEEDLSEVANSALAELSIESVLGFLGYDR